MPENEEMELTSTEARLRGEIAELKRQLAEHKKLQPARPARRTLFTMAALIVLAIAGAFLGGYIPRQRREAVLFTEARAAVDSLPVANVVRVERSSPKSELVLPGNIQAVTEAPILARASGYIKRRLADIGDRVSTGQLLAEIEAPELDQEVRQAKAALQQVQSAVEQTLANLEQGKTNQELARVTAVRWANLALKGAVSRQENDQYQAQYKAQSANVQALEKAVAAARNNVAAAEANVARLTGLQGYKQVRAPFAGVVTLRNVDVGALITAGNTMLFRIAQKNVLRTYVNVPQANSVSVRAGQTAQLTIPDLPGRRFTGTVTRNASALDPSTRTLLTEVQVPNTDGMLLPGMYAIVDLTASRKDPPLLIPGDTLVVRSNGPQVAIVEGDHKVHFQPIQLGRDYGDRLEVLSGLEEGAEIVVNPSDFIREGAKVNPVMLAEKPGAKSGPHAAGGSH